MIEIEIRYKISDVKNLEKRLENFTPRGERAQNDIYYDFADYALYRNGNSLRVRNNERLDFKINIGDDKHNFNKETCFAIDSINERNESFLNIFRILDIKIRETGFSNFDEFMALNKLSILCPINKTRASFGKGEGIGIEVDNVENLGTFLEAEIMMDEEENIDTIKDYIKKIRKFLDENELVTGADIEQTAGYVELYLNEYNRPIYELSKYKI